MGSFWILVEYKNIIVGKNKYILILLMLNCLTNKVIYLDVRTTLLNRNGF